MSLDKAIKSGKEHRAPYRRAKAMTTSCRNNGSCSYCRDNRRHSTRKRELIAGSPQVLMPLGDEDLMTSERRKCDGCFYCSRFGCNASLGGHCSKLEEREMDEFELELDPEEQQQRAMRGRGEWADWN